MSLNIAIADYAQSIQSDENRVAFAHFISFAHQSPEIYDYLLKILPLLLQGKSQLMQFVDDWGAPYSPHSPITPIAP